MRLKLQALHKSQKDLREVPNNNRSGGRQRAGCTRGPSKAIAARSVGARQTNSLVLRGQSDLIGVWRAVETEIQYETIEKGAGAVVAIERQRGSDGTLANCHSSSKSVCRFCCRTKSRAQKVGMDVTRNNKSARGGNKGRRHARPQHCADVSLAEKPRGSNDKGHPSGGGGCVDCDGRTKLRHAGCVSVSECGSEVEKGQSRVVEQDGTGRACCQVVAT